MGEIVGRFTCPVCGEPLQDVKVNKNYKLYCFCDNGCKTQLGTKNSKQALAALKSGKSIAVGKLGMITPLEYAKPAVTESRKAAFEEDLGI